MTCKSDGSGSWIGFTVSQDGQCSTANVSNAQLLIQQAGTAITAGLLIKLKESPAWGARIARNASPNVQDGIGVFEKMRYGNTREHDVVIARFDWPWEAAAPGFDPLLLLGAKGTLRTVGSDGTHYEDSATVVDVTVQPDRIAKTDSIGEIHFSWDGGSNPTYTGP